MARFVMLDLNRKQRKPSRSALTTAALIWVMWPCVSLSACGARISAISTSSTASPRNSSLSYESVPAVQAYEGCVKACCSRPGLENL